MTNSAFCRPATRLCVLLLLGFALVSTSGCQTVRYRTMEVFGIEKRDILATRVENARDAQDDAREQFATALDRFRETVRVDGGDLEQTYSRLDREFRRSVSRAEAVTDRINAVERVAEDLFDEWKNELDLYTDPDLRARSQAILQSTRTRYDRMLSAMRRAEQSMGPVIDVFQDQVLLLKHNLNSLAVATIREELAGIERATQQLIAAMNESIQQANQFIASLD
jgi:hypothetical protein